MTEFGIVYIGENIKLLKQKNKWSCTLTSAAMLLERTPSELIAFLGHDGSKIIHPNLPEPMNRKGHHLQEIIDMVLFYGYSLTPIEACPVQTPDGLHEHELKECGPYSDMEERFYHYLESGPGLLVGRGGNYHHVVAWDGYNVYDPCGDIYLIEDCNLEIQMFWLLTNY